MRQLTRRDLLIAAAAGSLKAQSGARTVAVGDLHGDPERFLEVLFMAGLVDGRQKWAGGNTVLVQLGDVVDRGPDSRGLIQLLIRLEKEARKAKGRVYPLIGNHEAMRVYGDLRYVPAAEYEQFRTPRSEEERARWYEREAEAMTEKGAAANPGFRDKWEKAHPLGQLELLRAFSTVGEFGRWILDQRAALVHNDTLFVHAGLSPRFVDWTVKRINDRVKEELSTGLPPEDGLCRSEDGPLWYRGLANLPEEQLAPHVDQLLANHKVKRIVVGHTPQLRGIASRFGGKVILADAGVSKAFGGRRTCLVIENGEAFALDEGSKKRLGSAE